MKKILKKYLSDQGFTNALGDLLYHPKVQEMRQYRHHKNTTCFDHSIHVAYISYRVSKILRFNVKATSRGALLHDLFLYDWKEHKPVEGLHGFVHPHLAFVNAKKIHDLQHREADIIKKHMWPLTITLPKYKETWVVVMVDKYCAISEYFW